jgi:PAS domain S-box-containing protein
MFIILIGVILTDKIKENVISEVDSGPFSRMNYKYAHYFRLFSTFAAIFSIFMGILVILGWIFSIPWLRGDIYVYSAVRFNGAIVFILMGLTLYLLLKNYQNNYMQILVNTLPVLVLFIIFINISQYIFGVNLGMDEFFIKDTSNVFIQVSPPGRIPPLISFEFILIGISLILLNLRKFLLSQLATIITCFLAVTSILGYLYDFPDMLLVESLIAIPLYAAFTIFILSLGIFFAFPQRELMKLLTENYVGSHMLRRVLPFAFIIPIVISLIAHLGHLANLFDPDMELTLLVVSTFILLTIVLARNAYSLNQQDKLRLKAMKELYNSELKNRLLVENAGLSIGYYDVDGKIILFNKIAANLVNANPKDLVGKHISDLFDTETSTLYLGRINIALESEESQIYEDKISFDGNKWFLSTFTRMKTKGGKIIGVQVISNDITALKNVETELKSSINDKNVLLREVHHRVKNNMQIISSLLSLQSNYMDDENALKVLNDSQMRVKSMAMIHEKLYQSKTFTEIDMAEYIYNLITEIFYTYTVNTNQIKKIIEIDDVKLNIETSVPCGLIISEIVTNSLKYAFPNRKEGEIRVSLLAHDDYYKLTIMDNGIGLPNNFKIDETETLGLQLVKSLVNQIDGEIELDRNHGTKYKITFKEMKYKKRK